MAQPAIAVMTRSRCCDFTRADHTDNWSRRLGEEHAVRAWRCRDLWDSGATVVLGSSLQLLLVHRRAGHSRTGSPKTGCPPT
ncbi:hypothetical protein [Streptomyces sp. NPDC006510]|uniref:hypothetical protein n=1 Tax=Streptomyces sp. NPDC006510 TaxID=3155600 RepID=UPI0033B68D97